MGSLLSDVRFAFRLLRRGPAFFATLIAVLVAGIGATTAMFSIVRSMFLEPLPYPDPAELTMMWRTDPRLSTGPFSIPDFVDIRTRAASFERVSAIVSSGVSLSSVGARPEPLQAALVSGDFFPMLGVGALAGRVLVADDDRPGAPRVAVLSGAVWRRRFASDPAIIGKAVTLNSVPYTVVGVAAEGFRFGGLYSSRADVWTPFTTGYERYVLDAKARGNHFFHVIGRRKPGVTIEQAQAEMGAIAKSLEVTYPDTNAKTGVRLVDLHDELVGPSRAAVWVLFCAIALVFLIVCANVAGLLLARAQTRRAEMATRAALGASTGRLTRQVVTETVVVFLLGAAGGGFFARWLVGAFADGIIEGSAARTMDIRVDAVALLFNVTVCLVCGIAFGLVPAWAVARVDPQTVLKDSAARTSVGRSQKAIRSGLVVAQVALAFALLVSSGLTLKAFASVAATPAGFDPKDVATMRIVIPWSKYDDDAKAQIFYEAVIAKIAARPDVTSVAGNDSLPMAGSNSSGSFAIEGRPPQPPGEALHIERNVVTPGYLRTMRIPLLRGRDFTVDDRREGRNVIILSQAAADTFFPGEDPIGKRMSLDDEADGASKIWREIVGVAGDVRRRGLSQPIVPEVFTPLAQLETHWMAVVVRSPRAAALMQEVPAIVASVDPDQAVATQRMMTDLVADSVGNQRYVALLLGAFAAAALVLATLGIFGLVSYMTSQRTRELGIRLALGSTPAGLVRLVVGAGLRLLAIGLGVGLACAALLARVVASRVPGVHAFDPLVYLAIPAILGVAGVVASLIPALRAVRIPPAIALRYE